MKFLLRSLLALSLITPVYAQDIIPPSPTATGTATTGQIPGTTTNDNAAAGKVGEYISSTVLVGNAVPLSDATNTNITSISLTAGDWDVWGNISFTSGTGTAVTALNAALSTVSASLPTSPGNGAFQQLQLPFTVNSSQILSAGIARFSLNSTTTIYLVARSLFTGGTNNGYGFIGARRVR